MFAGVHLYSSSHGKILNLPRRPQATTALQAAVLISLIAQFSATTDDVDAQSECSTDVGFDSGSASELDDDGALPDTSSSFHSSTDVAASPPTEMSPMDAIHAVTLCSVLAAVAASAPSHPLCLSR